MSVLKTKPTEVSAESHIAGIANEEQRNDAQTLAALMRRVTKQEPRMWGPSIIGFGSYHYKYASGHEGDSALTGFAVRGSELVVYIAPGFEGRDDLLAKLGKHKTGKVCLYVRRLANVDRRAGEVHVRLARTRSWIALERTKTATTALQIDTLRAVVGRALRVAQIRKWRGLGDIEIRIRGSTLVYLLVGGRPGFSVAIGGFRHLESATQAGLDHRWIARIARRNETV